MVRSLNHVDNFARITACRKRIFRINVYTAKGINDLNKRCKVNPRVEIKVHVIKLFQRCHGCVYTIDSRMGQFVFLSAGDSRNLHIVISRCCDKKNLVAGRVHDRDDIYIASAVGLDCAKHIDTADINAEGLIFYFHIRGLILQFTLDAISIDHLRILCVSFKGFLKDSRVSFVVNDCVNLAVMQGFRLFCKTVVFLCSDIASKLTVYRFHSLSDLISVHGILNAKSIICSILNILCRIVRHHRNDHIVQLVIAT